MFIIGVSPSLGKVLKVPCGTNTNLNSKAAQCIHEFEDKRISVFFLMV